jgi:hypothetical protein
MARLEAIITLKAEVDAHNQAKAEFNERYEHHNIRLREAMIKYDSDSDLTDLEACARDGMILGRERTKFSYTTEAESKLNECYISILKDYLSPNCEQVDELEFIMPLMEHFMDSFVKELEKNKKELNYFIEGDIPKASLIRILEKIKTIIKLEMAIDKCGKINKKSHTSHTSS